MNDSSREARADLSDLVARMNQLEIDQQEVFEAMIEVAIAKRNGADPAPAQRRACQIMQRQMARKA